MNSLPIEILSRIAFNLSFSDRKTFALVCKRFNKSIYFKEIWRDVTYVIGKSSINDLHKHFLNILSSVKFFSLSISSEQLHDVLKHCRNLEDLSLNICFDLFNEGFVRRFTESITCEARETLSRLRGLDLSGNGDFVTDSCFNSLIRHCRRLERIDLSGLTILKASPCKGDQVSIPTSPVFISRHLSFDNVITQLFTIGITLKSVRLCSTSVGREELLLIAGLPSLSAVSLDKCEDVDPRAKQLLLDHLSPTLSYFSMLATAPASIGFLETVLSVCPLLATLKLTGRGSRETQSTFVFPGHRPPDIINSRVPLQSPSTSCTIALRHLHLQEFLLPEHLIDTLNDARNLSSLSLRDCDFRLVHLKSLSLPRLIHIDLSLSRGPDMAAFLLLIFSLTTIRELLLDSVKITDRDLHNLSSLKGLQVLSLVGCSGLTAESLGGRLRSLSGLRVLRLQGVRAVDDAFLSALLSNARYVEELDLTGAFVTEGSLERFLGRAHKLRRLRIDNCGGIGDGFSMRLRRLCPYLQEVSMRNCDLLENEVALSYYDNIFLHDLSPF